MVLDATTPRSPDTPRVEPTSQAGCRSRVRVERLRRGAPAAHKSPRESLTKRRTVGLPSPPSRPRDRRVIRGTPRKGSAEKNRRHEVFLVRDVFFGPFGILLDRKNRFFRGFPHAVRNLRPASGESHSFTRRDGKPSAVAANAPRTLSTLSSARGGREGIREDCGLCGLTRGVRD